MNLTILGILLAVIQILLAIWYFDWNSWDHIIVSILLFLGGIIGFLVNTQSKFLMKIKKLIHIIGFALVIFLLIKLLFIG
jgi:hypothetical protein